MTSTALRCAADMLGSRVSSWAYPSTALSGVRISCDMLARKSPLAWFARSAASLAPR